MTKDLFIQFYDLFTSLVKQEVNDEYCMNASCMMVDYCGGYCLEIRPDCLLWGAELSLMYALADRFCLQMRVSLYDGVISFL